MPNEYPTLPFETIREPLDSILVTVANKLEREWPSRWSSLPGAAILLRAIVNVAGNTYKSIRFICADVPPDPLRRPEYALSVPPLARTILDNVFTVVFLFENLPARTQWFYKSGWRELYKELQRYQIAYGSDPRWTEWLAQKSRLVEETKVSWGITPEEELNPTRIKWWPNPGKMKSDPQTSQAKRDYLTYLSDWFYGRLSAASHLSWLGVAMHSANVFIEDREQRSRILNKFRSDYVMMTITLVLALISEIQIEINYNLSERLRYVWGILNPFWEEAKELYDFRYASLL